MININLLSGPGAGKSTTAAGLFYEMKKRNLNVEYEQEYPKELVYGKDYTRLSDQLLIVAEQHHRMRRLEGDVDYVIHDGPFLLSLVYYREDEHLSKKKFSTLVLDLHKSYKSINIFLERNNDLTFQSLGRVHNEEQSREKDIQILKMLRKNKIKYYCVPISTNVVQDIISTLEKDALCDITRSMKSTKILKP